MNVANNPAPIAVIAIEDGSGADDDGSRTIRGMLKDPVPFSKLLLKIVALVNGVVEIRPANTNVLVSNDALSVVAPPTDVLIPNIPESAFTLKNTPMANVGAKLILKLLASKKNCAPL